MSDEYKHQMIILERNLLKLREECELARLGLQHFNQQFIEQQQLLDRALSLLGLTADDLKAEANTTSEPRKLLLQMRRAEN